MQRTLTQWIAPMALFIWGVVMLYFYVSTRINFYVVAQFRWLALIAGLGLIVVALFNILTRNEDAACNHAHDDEGEDGCDSTSGAGTNAMIVLVPLVAASLLTKEEFSLDALENKGLYSATPDQIQGGSDLSSGDAAEGEAGFMEFTLEDLKAQVQQTPDGHFLLGVPDLFFSAGDEELQKVMSGISVEVTAQVIAEKVNNEEGHRLRLFQLFVQCCAADARPLSFPIDFGKTAPEIADKSWVKVRGKLDFPTEAGIVLPVVQVDTMEETTPPVESMAWQ